MPAAGPAHRLPAGAGARARCRGFRGLWPLGEAVEAGVPRQGLWRECGRGQGAGWALGSGGRGAWVGEGSLGPTAPGWVPLPAAHWRRWGLGPRHRAPAATGVEGSGARGARRCPCGGERGRSGAMSPRWTHRALPVQAQKGLIASDGPVATSLGIFGGDPASGWEGRKKSLRLLTYAPVLQWSLAGWWAAG